MWLEGGDREPGATSHCCPASIQGMNIVSPPANKPTEGQDLCETDVPSMATHSVTLLICLCGLAGNGAVLWLLGFRIQRDTMKPITAYILDLEDFSCSSIMPPASIRFLFLLFRMFYSVGLYRLTASASRGAGPCSAHLGSSATFPRTSHGWWSVPCSGPFPSLPSLPFLRLKTRNSVIFSVTVADVLLLLLIFPSTLVFLVEDVSCTAILPLLYLDFLFGLSMLSCNWGLLWLWSRRGVFYMEKLCKLCCTRELPQRLLSVVASVEIGARFALSVVSTAVTFLRPSHQQERRRAALISMYTIILLLFVILPLISSPVLFIRAKCGSQQQQPKRHDIVTSILALFTLLLSLCSFLQQLGYIPVSSDVVLLLTCIHSSIKPFIYLAGRCWMSCSVQSFHLSLHRVFEEPGENTAHSDDPAMDTVL
ncbi:hypothetical protein EK904_012533 [Melospiza melodia maxima]|nr:hypothetical protein EK904_012533 [Melospiza melodia maxima]